MSGLALLLFFFPTLLFAQNNEPVSNFADIDLGRDTIVLPSTDTVELKVSEHYEKLNYSISKKELIGFETDEDFLKSKCREIYQTYTAIIPKRHNSQIEIDCKEVRLTVTLDVSHYEPLAKIMDIFIPGRSYAPETNYFLHKEYPVLKTASCIRRGAEEKTLMEMYQLCLGYSQSNASIALEAYETIGCEEILFKTSAKNITLTQYTAEADQQCLWKR